MALSLADDGTVARDCRSFLPSTGALGDPVPIHTRIGASRVPWSWEVE